MSVASRSLLLGRRRGLAAAPRCALLSRRIVASPSLSSPSAYSLSYSTTASSSSSTSSTALLTLKLVAALAASSAALFYLSDSRSFVWKHVVMPVIHATIDPEDAHVLSIWLARRGFVPHEPADPSALADQGLLNIEVWGRPLENPIGLAAGYDKHGEAIDAMLGLGFGLVEVGSVTPKPQPGNPKPRMFRLTKDEAVINRYGFNSDGHDVVEGRLRSRIRAFWYKHQKEHKKGGENTELVAVESEKEAYAVAPPSGVPRSLKTGRLLGVNLGKNKASAAESNADYVDGIAKLGPYADYVVVNISSPNTPGLRSLQRREPMLKLLNEVKAARDATLVHRPPLLVKIAPDVTDDELEDIAHVIKDSGIDGVIISNTTISRPSNLQSDPKLRREFGGLSGPPVKPLALAKVEKFYRLTGGSVPIVGCGGIKTADDALAFARAGASVVQLYTGLAYDGPGIVSDIKTELTKKLKEQGTSWKDVVGAGHRKQ